MIEETSGTAGGLYLFDYVDVPLFFFIFGTSEPIRTGTLRIFKTLDQKG
jgi:hypothetical protein